MILRFLLILAIIKTVKAASSAARTKSHGRQEDPLCPISKSLSKTLNIHIVPHTHDDVGWLKTVDQYYYGLNNTIQQAHVSLILDNVLHQLLDTSSRHNRTFTYVETAFFSKWYLSLSSAQQISLKSLIDKKQFSFANGGWCMHDEATTHFIGMIDQTTLGHDFLKRELGVVPTVGWQIDPFGHSATQAGLMTAGMGFDALYFGRIHYVDLENRQNDGECEGLWKSSTYDGGESVFWGLSGSYRGNYGAPEGFCFDVLCDDDPLVGLEESDLEQRIEKFLKLVGEQAGRTKGGNVMLTMGSDFQFSQARKNYQNLDLLIDATSHYLNNGPINLKDIFGDRFEQVEIFYSTPERYTQCKYVDFLNAREQDATVTSSEYVDQFSRSSVEPRKESQNSVNWKMKTGDFFPYADCDHCYWTGFFSSRQGLKRLERVGSSFLHAARQIESIRKLQIKPAMSLVSGELQGISKLISSARNWNDSPLYILEDAMGVAQHHDAVAGTSKQHVAYDYAKRIANGISSASSFVTRTMRELLLDADAKSQGLLDNLGYCQLLNETICDVSQAASKVNSKTMYVVVYNALSSCRSEVVSIPVADTAGEYRVERLVNSPKDWAQVSSTVILNAGYTNRSGAAGFILYFEASELPPIGARIFRINKVEGDNTPFLSDANEQTTAIHPRASPNLSVESSHLRANQLNKENNIVITNGILSVTCDRSSGVIKLIADKHTQLELEQNYGYYESFYHLDHNQMNAKSPNFETSFNVKGNGMCLPGYIDSEGDEMPWLLGTAENWQNSGAYIFRTSDRTPRIIPPKTSSVIIHETDLVSEIHAKFGADGPVMINQITRLIKGKNYVEVEYVVSSISIDDGIGKEVVSRFSTNIASHRTFFTDSNGREFIERTRGTNKLYGSLTHDPVSIEPIAGNYYPVNAGIYIEDENRSLSILVDRSQGASSLSDGTIELMIQRRLLHDDARGVAEPLNETDIGITPNPPYGDATRIGEGIVIKGIHRLMIGVGRNGAAQARSRMDEVFSHPHIFVSSAPADVEVPFQQAALSGLESPLPANVMLVTFAPLRELGVFLVRVANQYGTDESNEYSLPTTIDLSVLFPTKTILTIIETTLSGNQSLEDWENRRLRWDGTNNQQPGSARAEAFSRNLEQVGTVISLRPLEIRTFEVRVA